MKSGIAVAGTILVDSINEISAYPEKGELTKIHSVEKAVGGCVPNVAIDLKRLSPSLPVKAIGKIGDDENGYRYIIASKAVDLRAKSKEINAAIDGKGGGQKEMIQGTAKASEAVIRKYFAG